MIGTEQIKSISNHRMQKTETLNKARSNKTFYSKMKRLQTMTKEFLVQIRTNVVHEWYLVGLCAQNVHFLKEYIGGMLKIEFLYYYSTRL